MESIAVFTLVINDVGETENITLKIDYEITSGKSSLSEATSVNSLTSDVSTKSLMINMTAPESGTLSITMPRSIIDSKSSWDADMDDIFLISLDGEEIEHVEESYQTDISDSRMITIPFMESSEVIEIIGTSVIEDLYTIGDGIAVATDIRIR
jgi:hypothetical protein|tara:strand:- start:117 stop:575 length:459 start_codon:yes stop_codon:yes gene_type:complete